MKIGNEKKIPCFFSSFNHYPKNDIILKNCVKKIFQAAAAASPICADVAAIFRCRHVQSKNCYYHHHISKITTIMIIKVSIIITIVSSSRSWGKTLWNTDCPRYVARLLSLSGYNASFQMDILKTYLNRFFGIETKYGASMQCWNI